MLGVFNDTKIGWPVWKSYLRCTVFLMFHLCCCPRNSTQNDANKNWQNNLHKCSIDFRKKQKQKIAILMLFISKYIIIFFKMLLYEVAVYGTGFCFHFLCREVLLVLRDLGVKWMVYEGFGLIMNNQIKRNGWSSV